jgi:hypothetical protein
MRTCEPGTSSIKKLLVARFSKVSQVNVDPPSRSNGILGRSSDCGPPFKRDAGFSRNQPTHTHETSTRHSLDDRGLIPLPVVVLHVKEFWSEPTHLLAFFCWITKALGSPSRTCEPRQAREKNSLWHVSRKRDRLM